MPVNIKVTVVISKRLQEAASRAPQVVLNHLRKAMNASILETETRIKEYITEIGLIKDGRLRNSIHGRIVSANIRQIKGEVATANVKYARIQEYGGTIVPKNGQALAIPFNKESAQVQMYGSLRNVEGLYVIRRGANEGFGGAAFLVSSKNPKLGWTLVKSVYIKEKRYMRTGFDRARPRILEFFRLATQRALKAVFGVGEGTASDE